MIIDYVSDLHLEFGDFSLPGGDILILAGDICEIKQLTSSQDNIYKRFFKEELIKYNKVIYVLGNHEHYGFKIHKSFETLNNFLPTNTTILEKNSIIIDDVLFLGGTLWTDFHKDDYALYFAKDYMNDYKYITVKNTAKGTYHKLYSKYVLQEHNNTKLFLLNELENNQNSNNPKKVIVISHHAPHKNSIINDTYIDKSNYPYYYSDLSNFFENYNIHSWIHGHIHEKSNYFINNTNILANPRGYFGKNKTSDNFKVEQIII